MHKFRFRLEGLLKFYKALLRQSEIELRSAAVAYNDALREFNTALRRLRAAQTLWRELIECADIPTPHAAGSINVLLLWLASARARVLEEDLKSASERLEEAFSQLQRKIDAYRKRWFEVEVVERLRKKTWRKFLSEFERQAQISSDERAMRDFWWLGRAAHSDQYLGIPRSD